MAVIKSSNVPSSAVPFSMRDIEMQARSMLLRARHQAEGLLAAAQAEAETLKSAARAEGLAAGRKEGSEAGHAAGLKEGRTQALAAQGEQLAQAMSALIAAVNVLEQGRCELEASALQEVVLLAIAVARRVTKRQAMLDPQVLSANLTEAMKLVSHNADVRVAFNPSQRQTIEEALPALRLHWPTLKHVELTEDPSLRPGGCRVYTNQGQIDADLESQLDRVIADLMPVPEKDS